MAADAALADVKVLDLMWVIAGPSATRVMADHGATIVRVESQTRVETARTIGPYRNGVSGPESSGAFDNYNAGKQGLTLDIRTDEAKGVIRDLVKWADVVAESFSPRAMRAWGLDYESLRQIKPDIIMLSTCLFGQTGPLSGIAGFGTMGSAISGFVNFAGSPDRPPVGPFGAYTDYLAPRFSLTALLAALDHRDRTGEGVYIDQAQAESALHFMTAALLDYDVNGRNAERAGNRDPHMAPHGVYAAQSDDSWVVVAARNDAEWRSLAAAIGSPQLADDARFNTLAARTENEGALDELVGAWTGTHSAIEVEQTLQSVGVPAYVVLDSPLAARDAQLEHRGHFVNVPHPVDGSTTVEGTRWRMSRTPPAVTRNAPTFGRDNEYVLKTILGYDDERITELAIAGALE